MVHPPAEVRNCYVVTYGRHLGGFHAAVGRIRKRKKKGQWTGEPW